MVHEIVSQPKTSLESSHLMMHSTPGSRHIS